VIIGGRPTKGIGPIAANIYAKVFFTIPASGRVAETLIRETGYWDTFNLENQPSAELHGPDSPNGRLMRRTQIASVMGLA
jgi:hypothetical protein